MAEQLARVFGSEVDKLNCPFYLKTGACRHGDSCTRTHHKVRVSSTILLKHAYLNPPAAVALAEGQDVKDADVEASQRHVEIFFEEIFAECARVGFVEEVKISDNVGDHLIGNVYVRFARETDARRALEILRNFRSQAVETELCAIGNLHDVRCRQFDDGECARGGFCNFLHWKFIPRALLLRLRRKYAGRQDFSDQPFDDKDL